MEMQDNASVSATAGDVREEAKNGKTSKVPKRRSEKLSRSKRAGLTFPVGRIHCALRKGEFSERIGSGAPVMLAATLEFLVNEILILSGKAAHAHGKSRITPHHIMLAIRNDASLNAVMSKVTIANGGVTPNIKRELYATNPFKKEKKSTK